MTDTSIINALSSLFSARSSLRAPLPRRVRARAADLRLVQVLLPQVLPDDPRGAGPGVRADVLPRGRQRVPDLRGRRLRLLPGQVGRRLHQVHRQPRRGRDGQVEERWASEYCNSLTLSLIQITTHRTCVARQ